MKNRFFIILIILALTVLLVLPVSAENFDYAEKLNNLGLFRGTDIGYELGRAPTRLEGAVMFVRLLGGEKEALEKNYSHPFKDVPPWGSPYVGYLYEYSLTKGISDNEFGSDNVMQSISYMTFALRSLGYSDDEDSNDFNWRDAVSFAYNRGLIDLELYIELNFSDFLRGHVARVSYEILIAETKAGGITLIEKLVKDGVVHRDNAESLNLLPYSDRDTDGLSIGNAWDQVVNTLGNPDNSQFSRYGFEWKIYDFDLNNYVQVGVENNIISGILYTSNGYSYEKDISIGMFRSDLNRAYATEPLDELRKPVPDENTIMIYTLDNENKSTYITSEGDYITYYFDSYEDYKITAVLVIDDAVELQTIESFSTSADELFYDSLEMQVFSITNSFRVQKGLEALEWSQKAEKAASIHSEDMADRDYFSHYTPEGDGFGDRLDDQDVDYVSAGENIAFGYRNPIHMINDWLNSATGHRDILLGEFDYIGIGVWIDGDSRMYCTQDYWR